MSRHSNKLRSPKILPKPAEPLPELPVVNQPIHVEPSIQPNIPKPIPVIVDNLGKGISDPLWVILSEIIKAHNNLVNLQDLKIKYNWNTAVFYAISSSTAMYRARGLLIAHDGNPNLLSVKGV